MLESLAEAGAGRTGIRRIMAAGISNDTLQRLIELGKQKGQLFPEDLFSLLPVDRMSAEDIALVVLEIEEAGVPVESEEALLTLSRPAEMRTITEAIALALPPLPHPDDSLRPDDASAHVSTRPVESSVGAAAHHEADGPRINRVVALAGVLTLLILGGGVLLLGR